jgi:hypothetical protein
MKRLKSVVFCFSAFTMLFSTSASASMILPCQNEVSLATILQMGSCTIGDKIISDLIASSAASGGAIAPTPAGITFDTIGPSGEGIFGLDFGFQLVMNLTALSGQTIDFNLAGTTTVAGGAPWLIDDTGLAQTSGVIADGSATIAEKGCGPAPCTPGTWGLITFDTGTPMSQTVSHTVFSPTGSVQWDKDFGLGGGQHGLATISRSTENWSQVSIGQVPEGGTLMLFGSGLLMLGLVRRRRKGEATQ